MARRCQLIIQPESNLLRTTRISGRQVQEVLRGRKAEEGLFAGVVAVQKVHQRKSVGVCLMVDSKQFIMRLGSELVRRWVWRLEHYRFSGTSLTFFRRLGTSCDEIFRCFTDGLRNRKNQTIRTVNCHFSCVYWRTIVPVTGGTVFGLK